MSFVAISTTVSSAVATGGTFTAVAPTAALAGAIKATGGHYFIARQMNAQFNFPNDWTVTWSGATATITYNGTTTIPAGTLVNVQFEVTGDNTNYTYHNTNEMRFDTPLKRFRGCFGEVFRVEFGATSNASTTAVVNAAARTGTNTLTTYASAFECDVPRALQYVSSNAGDTTQTVTTRGFDEYGVALTETATLNGTTPVLGKKAFKTVVSDTVSATLAGNLSIGTQNVFGLPFYLPKQTGTGVGHILKESQDGATPTAGTFVGGDLTKASATTGDVRGTVTPNVTPDGTKVYEVFMFVADTTFLGVPQFGT